MPRFRSIAAAWLLCATFVAARDAHAQTVLEGPVQLAWTQAHELDSPVPYPGSAVDSVSDGQRVYVLSELETSSVLRAFDGASGALAWQLEYAGPDSLGARLEQLALSADGLTLFAVGHAQLQAGAEVHAHGVWLRVDAGQGALLGNALDAHGDSSYSRIALASDDSALYVLGQHGLDAAIPGALISARYAWDGTLVWRTLEPGTGAQERTAQDVALAANGTLLRAWTSVEETDDDPIELAFAVGGPATDGSVAWQHSWLGEAGPLGWHPTLDGAHAVLSNLSGPMPYAQRVASASGAIEWSWSPFESELGHGVAFDPLTQRTYVLWGPSEDGHFDERSLTALEPTGAEAWTGFSASGRFASAQLALDHARSRIHVAGETNVLAAYPLLASFSSTTGALIWSCMQSAGGPAPGSLRGHWAGVHLLSDGRLTVAGDEFAPQADGFAWSTALAEIDPLDGDGVAWHGAMANAPSADELELLVRASDGVHLLLAGTAAGHMTFALAQNAPGPLLWRRDFTAEAPVGLSTGVFEDALVHGELCVLTGVRGSYPFVLAVDRTTGETVWTRGKPLVHVNYATRGVSNAVLSPDGNVLYAAHGGAYAQQNHVAVEAFDFATGALLWSAPIDADPQFTLRVRLSPDGTRVYASSSKPKIVSLHAFEAQSGVSLWRYEDHLIVPGNQPYEAEDLALSADGSTLVCATRYVQSNLNRAKLRSLDAHTGALLAAVEANVVGAHSYTPHDLRIGLDGKRVHLSSTTVDAHAFVPYTRVDAYALPALAHVWTRVTDIDIAPTPPPMELDPDGTKLYVAGAAFWMDYMAKVLAIAAADGLTRWAAEHTTHDLAALPFAAGLALDASARRMYAGGHAKEGDTLDWRLWALDLPSMTQSAKSVSLANGGAVNLEVSVGPQHAGAWRLVLGSVSGSSPGLQIAGLHLPLNVDAYFLHTLQTPNTPPLVRNLAPLSSQGAGAARFALPPGSQASLAGLELTHAALVFDASFAPTLVTNPVSFELQP